MKVLKIALHLHSREPCQSPVEFSQTKLNGKSEIYSTSCFNLQSQNFLQLTLYRNYFTFLFFSYK